MSVEAGHYYQGRLGQRFFARLRSVGVLPPDLAGRWEDDAAFESGVGFTDIVKRPTRNANEVRDEEFTYGRKLLADKLEQNAVPLVIFTFKKAAREYFGPFQGNGLVPALRIGRSKVFVMPGPMERAETSSAALAQLENVIAGLRSKPR